MLAATVATAGCTGGPGGGGEAAEPVLVTAVPLMKVPLMVTLTVTALVRVKYGFMAEVLRTARKLETFVLKASSCVLSVSTVALLAHNTERVTTAVVDVVGDTMDGMDVWHALGPLLGVKLPRTLASGGRAVCELFRAAVMTPAPLIVRVASVLLMLVAGVAPAAGLGDGDGFGLPCSR
jgi:hypothetical protein